MTEHTRTFITIKNIFKEIYEYNKGDKLNVERFGELFLLELSQINIQYNSGGKVHLSNDEMLLIKDWIYVLQTNHYLSRKLRTEIAIEGHKFCQIMDILLSITENQL